MGTQALQFPVDLEADNERLRARVTDLESMLKIRSLTQLRILAFAESMLVAPKPVSTTQIHDHVGFNGTCVVMDNGQVFYRTIADAVTDGNGMNFHWTEREPLPGTRAAVRREISKMMEEIAPTCEEVPS